MASEFQPLVSEYINGLFIGNDQWTIVFRTAGGKYFRFDTQKDCCNSVWYNHISGIEVVLGVPDNNVFDLLSGALVTGVEEKGWSTAQEEQPLTDSKYVCEEVIEDGFWSIYTDRGQIDIEVRNSHNGYYGGSISYVFPTEFHKIENLKQVTKDF
jgi:hypothetical protein